MVTTHTGTGITNKFASKTFYFVIKNIRICLLAFYKKMNNYRLYMNIRIDYYMFHFNWMIKVHENIGVPFWINLIVNVIQYFISL